MYRMQHWCRRALMPLVFVLGCGRGLKAPPAPVEQPASLLEVARKRPVPEVVAARVSLKVRSKPLKLAGTVGAGLVVERPGRGRLDVVGPFGGTLLTLSSDGEALSVLLVGARRHLVAADAEAVVREVSSGAAGLDDLVSVLVGDIPFDDVEATAVSAAEDGSAMARLEGPRDTELEVHLDQAGMPTRIDAFDPKGGLLLSAVYEGFEEVDGGTLPTALTLELPSLELTIDMRYKSWSVLGEAPVDFTVGTPEGFAAESLEDAVRAAAVSAALQMMAPAGD